MRVVAIDTNRSPVDLRLMYEVAKVQLEKLRPEQVTVQLGSQWGLAVNAACLRLGIPHRAELDVSVGGRDVALTLWDGSDCEVMHDLLYGGVPVYNSWSTLEEMRR